MSILSTISAAKALLPAGFREVLPYEAAARSQVISRLLAIFESYGYDLVIPPTMEFEDSLFTGAGKAVKHQTFRVMDPVSRKMMGLRADITMQIARIASSRLHNEPLPLRLSYSGQVFRVKAMDLDAERQVTQAGIELIGVDDTYADAEVVLVAADALTQLGIKGLSVDFSIPQLITLLLDHLGFNAQTTKLLRNALSRKDMHSITDLAGDHAKTLIKLSTPHSNPAAALALLKSLDLPKAAQALCARLEGIMNYLTQHIPSLAITVDPLEHRGFEYHTGISFAFFCKESAGELGRGGHYVITPTDAAQQAPLEAVGFSLYVNNIFRILPIPAAKKRIAVAAQTSLHDVKSLHEQGWVTLQVVDSKADIRQEAKRLKCQAVYVSGKVEAV